MGMVSVILLLPHVLAGAEVGADGATDAGIADDATGPAAPAPTEAAAVTIKAPPPPDCSIAAGSATASALPSSQAVGSGVVGCRMAGAEFAAATACWIVTTPDPPPVESPGLTSPSDAAATAGEDAIRSDWATVPSPDAAGLAGDASRVSAAFTVSVEAASPCDAVTETSAVNARAASAASLG
jgi:hypothetical protein